MTDHRPTGEQLLDELRAAAVAAGKPLTQFVAPLVTSSPQNFIAQLGRAGRPIAQTVERVRACVEGRPIPLPRPSPFKGHAGGARVHQAADSELRCNADEVARRRALADRAHAERRPGETLDQAVKRLRGDEYEQRRGN